MFIYTTLKFQQNPICTKAENLLFSLSSTGKCLQWFKIMQRTINCIFSRPILKANTNKLKASTAKLSVHSSRPQQSEIKWHKIELLSFYDVSLHGWPPETNRNQFKALFFLLFELTLTKTNRPTITFIGYLFLPSNNKKLTTTLE